MGGNYFIVLVLLFLSFGLGAFLFLVSVFLSTKILGIKDAYVEKVSGYECGFNPFSDARGKFDVRFYLVGILFVIFDLEVVFLFPWSVCLGRLGATGFWIAFIFLVILTIGFYYEWSQGAIEWE